MKRRLCLAPLVLFLAAPEKPAAADREPLAGTWKVVAVEVRGKPLPPRFLKDLKLAVTVTADQVTLRYFWERPRRETFRYRLDPTRRPAWITATFPGKEGRTVPGVYRHKGDRLEVCFSTADPPERPGEFRSAKPGQVLLRLRRQKP